MEAITPVVSFAGAFSLGIIFAVLGAVKLRLADILQVNDAQYGRLISTLMFASLIAVLIIGPLQDAIGYMPIGLVGFVAGGVCLWLLAGAKTYGIALMACALLGIGAMCVNTIGNTLGPAVLFDGENPALAQNLINAFFGLGGFLTPIFIGKFADKLGYQKTVSIIGAVVFALVILVFLADFPEAAGDFELVASLGLLGTGAVIFGGLSLFCYIGLEASMAGFVSTYLKDQGLTDEQANKGLSGFWIALIGGRILAAFLLWVTALDVVYHAPIIPVLGIAAAIVIYLMVVAETPKAGVVAAVLTGLVLGPIFPTVVGVTFFKSAAIEAGTAGSVFGWIFAIGLLGATLIPMLIGKLSAEGTIRQSMRAAVVVAAVLVVFSGILWLGVPEADPEAVEEIVTMAVNR